MTGYVYRFDYDVDDDGAPVSAYWEYPLRFAGVDQELRFDGIEATFKQVASGPAVTVSVGTSEALAEDDGPSSYTTIGSHDTTLATRQLLTADGPAARLMNVKMAVSSSRRLAYRGAVQYAYTHRVA